MASVQLDPPGAGVPWWQVLFGKYVFVPYYSRRLSWDDARELLLREGLGLLALGEDKSDDTLARRVLIPSQIGLEDSSRHWSYAMVLEHLVILGGRAADVIIELSHGRTPAGDLRTADLKPRGKAPVAETTKRFREFLDVFHARTAEETGDRRSKTTYMHPWFGPLTAHQWICFLPFHQRIHIKQARWILRDLQA